MQKVPSCAFVVAPVVPVGGRFFTCMYKHTVISTRRHQHTQCLCWFFILCKRAARGHKLCGHGTTTPQRYHIVMQWRE